MRLVSSSSTSLTVEWDYPTVHGGALVQGFELWMDDWAGGAPRLVFDGTDQPDVQTFTVRTSTSLGVESGRQYRFLVRAINYCSDAEPTLACYGAFSPVSYFTVRAPKPPLPPAAPSRDAFSGVGTELDAKDASVVVNWLAPDDNGGEKVESYYLYVAAPGGQFQSVTDAGSPVYPSADAMREFSPSNQAYRLLVSRHGLVEGELYRFTSSRSTPRGRSAKSPVLSAPPRACPAATPR